MSDSWIRDVLPLPRPEYSKQPEALLTDLLWRSGGSNLRKSPGTPEGYLAWLGGLPGGTRDRLVPLRSRGGSRDTVETLPLVERVDISMLINGTTGANSLVNALLSSVLAPRARGDKSYACVPVHPDIVILQTLQGLVNKKRPPDLSEAIEVVGWLGGAQGRGEVASVFLRAMTPRSAPSEGVAGLLDTLVPEIARQTWELLADVRRPDASPPPPWPGVDAVTSLTPEVAVLANLERTPFRWFWDKWRALCDPASGWYMHLPIRRFIDWSTCLLRTGLAFAYLWEAEFFTRVHAIVASQAIGANPSIAQGALRAMLDDGAILATIESPLLPATQKDAGQALRSALAKGYAARKRFSDDLRENRFGAAPGQELADVVVDWINDTVARGETDRLARLGERLPPDASPSKNTREFVRYLLLPRSADDDSADQADFYSFARSNSRQFWFEPGPEWLVVVTSLLGRVPGGKCTLGMLVNDLARLGVRVERLVLVGMLEEAGLSTDSPDADNALVIRSGF